MRLELSDSQRQARQRFRAFARSEIAPHAGRWEKEEAIPPQVVDRLREEGFLGAPLPRELGGGGMDPITYGLLTEELGRACSSVRTLLTVHDMSTLAIARWGKPPLKDRLLPRLARGEILAVLGLTEPEAGSDAASVRTRAERSADGYTLTGTKRWTSFGRLADVCLTFARLDDQPAAFAVETSAPGFSRRPMEGITGTAASMLAEITLEGCAVPEDSLVGRVGFGISAVAATALDHGRYSVAWGSVGIAQACLDACLEYTGERHQFGKPLAEHQLVQRKLTEMIADTRAARLLCYRAGYQRQVGDPGAATETMVAKYFASRAAVRAASDAVQLHGANGCSPEYPVARFLRDAKVTEIIEGSTQIQQVAIARFPPGEL